MYCDYVKSKNKINMEEHCVGVLHEFTSKLNCSPQRAVGTFPVGEKVSAVSVASVLDDRPQEVKVSEVLISEHTHDQMKKKIMLILSCIV